MPEKGKINEGMTEVSEATAGVSQVELHLTSNLLEAHRSSHNHTGDDSPENNSPKQTGGSADEHTSLVQADCRSPASFVSFSGVAFCAPGDESAVAEQIREAILRISTASIISICIPPSTAATPSAVPSAVQDVTEGDAVPCDSDAASCDESKWGPATLYLPREPFMTLTPKPLLASDCFVPLITRYDQVWNALLVTAVLLALCGIVFVCEFPGPTSELLSLFLWAVFAILLALHVAQYSRSTLKRLVRTFDFLFVSFQMLLFLVGAVVALIKSDETTYSIFGLVMMAVCTPILLLLLAGMDASPSIAKRGKGVFSLVMAASYMLFWYEAKSLPSYWSEPLGIAVFYLTPAGLYQSSCVSLFSFTLKYAVRSLYFKEDVVVLSCPQRVAVENVRCEGDGGERRVTFSNDFSPPNGFSLLER